MPKSKTIDRICCMALVVMLVLTTAIWTGKASAGKQKTIEVGYESFFDQSRVHTIDLEISDFDSFLSNATQEEYTACTVTLDGEKISNVGIRAKGNTSLSSVSEMDSQKYSFKLEFDHFVEGRTWRGLDKLSLNNLIYDATMMKDYLAYTLMGKMEVPSPLCSYVQITINGEPWGLYLAVESVENSFLERNNMTTGELYKPDSQSFGGGRGNGWDFDFDQFKVDQDTDSASGDTATDTSAATQSTPQMPGGMFPPGMGGPPDFAQAESDGDSPSFDPQAMGMPDSASADSSGDSQTGSFPSMNFNRPMPNMGGDFNFGNGSSDVKLQYSDDDFDSYSNIFDSAKTKINKIDKTRLIQALKTLSSDEAENAVFADEVMRYFAVHDFLQNDDSYTGAMIHNYYLYEDDGKLAILPWDYNLAMGGFSGGTDGTETINSPIDSPVSMGSLSDRPLVAWIFNSEETTARYHEIYDEFITNVIESGWLTEEISRVSAMIRPYVEQDPNGFYTVEEFDAAIEALQSYCTLRAESIRGQLEGTIPSTSEGQSADSSTLVNASSLDLTLMGVMNRGGQQPGGGGMGGPSFNPFSGQSPGDTSSGTASDPTAATEQELSAAGTETARFTGVPSGMTMPDSGNATSSTEPALSGDSSVTASQSTPVVSGELAEADATSSQGAPDTSGDATTSADQATSQAWSGPMPDQMSGFPGGPPSFPGMSAEISRTDYTANWIILGVCTLGLLAALFAVSFFFKAHND
ncbi:MAG: CotH kinase family protein [Clostridia bacterium]|nr:CotH kinase family protein [Clostridia bacterium]